MAVLHFLHFLIDGFPVRHFILPLLAVTLCSLTAAAQELIQPPADPQNFHLFVLAGQSNMAGRGKVEPQDQQPHPRVLALNKAGEWVPAVDPLHFDKPGIVGVGLGRSFAQAYADSHPGVVVGLLPCAVGGSPIDAWQPGGFHPSTKTHPWDDCVARVLPILESGTLKGVLWHQGESDAKPELAETYETKLHEIVARFRTTLEAPCVPFIAGQMGQFEERPWDDSKKMVDKAHQRLPSLVAVTAFVSSDDLKHKGDKVHFDAASYRELGQRYYAAYQQLTCRQQQSPGSTRPLKRVGNVFQRLGRLVPRPRKLLRRQR